MAHRGRLPSQHGAVEFRDFVAVVEAPQNEARSLVVIAEVRRLIPNQPIRYVVNTHHHFDHAGGLRTYMAQSTTVVTHQGNRDFYGSPKVHVGHFASLTLGGGSSMLVSQSMIPR